MGWGFGLVIARPQGGRGNLGEAPANFRALRRPHRLPNLSLRGGRRPTWQSRTTRLHHRKAIGEIAAASPRFPRRFAPRNDKPESLCVRRKCQPTCRPPWRSMSAATDAIGAHHFIDTRCELPALRREGTARPLQRMTGGLVKFSTFQFHFPRAAPLHMCYPILQKGLLRGSCSRPFAPR